MRQRRGEPQSDKPLTQPGQQPKTSAASANPSGPSLVVAFVPLLIVRLISARFNTIADCDETFNFWEPAHYLAYGFGQQTWEYSPRFALRSYSYLIVPAFLACLLASLGIGKISVFFGVRAAFGAGAAFCEAFFCSSAATRFGGETGWLLLALLVGSSGMFHASTAFLPSSFCMELTILMYGAWMKEQYRVAMLCGVISVILPAWPFVGFIYIPFAIHVLFHMGFVRPIMWGVKSLFVVVLPIMVIDSKYYQRLVFPCWNIFKYNILGGSGGSQSQLYGTAPWHFYLVNGILNLNLCLILGLCSGIVLLLIGGPRSSSSRGGNVENKGSDVAFYLAPMYMWFAAMSLESHKEERFLFPIYPLLIFASAMSLASIKQFPWRVWPKSSSMVHHLSALLVGLFVLGSCCLSFSRSYGTLRNYSAPLSLYTALQPHLQSVQGSATVAGTTVCVGKEWYRFPASFFLPSETRLGFVNSSFGGQLPAPFLPLNGTSSDGTIFNDQNLPHHNIHVPFNQCDVFVDLELVDQDEEKLTLNNMWDVVEEFPFLDAAHSKSLYRAFYVPLLTPKHTRFARYVALRRRATE